MKKTTYLILMTLVILITCVLQWFYCCSKTSLDTTDKKVVVPIPEKQEVIPEATKNPFSVADGDFSVNVHDNFNFKSSSFDFEIPVSEKVNGGIIKVKEYVAGKNDKEIHITGFYTESEQNNSIYPNLGIARANAVKNYFVQQGISSKLINTYGELKNDLVPENDLFYGPVKFGLPTVKVEETEDFSILLKELQANPLVLYFKTGQASINLTKEQRSKVSKLSRYLDKVEEAVCLVVGHTDNVGDPAKNKVLGKERAEFAKKYLVKNAIPLARIETLSKGDTEPTAPNDTEEGRAKNRRTVITIK